MEKGFKIHDTDFHNWLKATDNDVLYANVKKAVESDLDVAYIESAARTAKELEEEYFDFLLDNPNEQIVEEEFNVPPKTEQRINLTYYDGCIVHYE